MALSIFLVGGMVLILIIAVWGLIHIMRPSVVEAPPGDIAPPSVLYSSRFQKFTKAVFLSLGLSSHLAKTTLHTFPPSMYSPRYLFGLKWELFNVNKLLTACLLILIGVLFSRHFIPKWVGLTWVDPAAGICVSEASKLAVFEDQLYAELRLPESTALVASLYTALTGLQTLMASSTVFPGTAYPEACQDAAEYVINQGLTKTCATSITADLGTYG